MLNVFIIYASKDSDLFKEFENYLAIALRNKKLIESIKFSSMDDFPIGKSSIASNRKALRENSTFLVLNSPSLQESSIITDFELPSLYGDPSKEIIPIQFIETPVKYGDSIFLRSIQFFVPEKSYIKIFGDAKRLSDPAQIKSQRMLFVEELIERLEISLNEQILKNSASPINSGKNANTTPKTRQTTRRKRLFQAFLCHASSDKQKVRELYKRLRNDGIKPWLDEEDLLPGFEWEIEIPKAVQNSDVVIVCLSKDAVTKTGYVQKEIKYALDIADEQPEGKIFIIPLKLEECDVPKRLSRWQWVNLFNENGYQRLLRSLNIRAKEKRA